MASAVARRRFSAASSLLNLVLRARVVCMCMHMCSVHMCVRPAAADLHRVGDSSGPDEWDLLISTLRSKASWGQRGLVTAMRTRALRHVVAETTTLLRRREASKAALLRLGGEVRRTILEQARG